MELQFISMSIKNVMSYGNVESVIDLSNKNTTIITGRNTDLQSSDGTTVNGIGKTTILLSLMFGLYDETIYKITKDDMINNINGKHMEIKIVFVKNNDTYMVRKARKMKSGAAGNFTELYKNGVLVDCNNPSDEVIKVLGIPFDIFSRMVTFSAKSQSFFELPLNSSSVCQTGIIESLFDLHILSEKADKLKGVIKLTEKSKESEQHQHALLQQQIDQHAKQVKSLNAMIVNWEATQQQNITKLQQQIEMISTIDIEYQFELFNLHQQASNAVAKLQSKQSDSKSKMASIKSAIKKLAADITQLENNTCPFCLQHMTNTESKIAEHESSIELLSDEMTVEMEKTNSISQDINELVQQISDCAINMIEEININKLMELNTNKAGILSKLEQLGSQQNPHTGQLQELCNEELPIIDMSAINELDSTLFHSAFLLKALTKKDSFIRKALLHKNLTYLNTRLTLYLKELGLPHKVLFTNDMTALITIRGKPLGYGNLSSGQKSRLNLALSLSFRDVLQRKYGSINLFVFDEVLDDGLDAIGMQNALKMLKKLAADQGLSIYIISHREDAMEQFDNKVMIEMTNGFSRIIDAPSFVYDIVQK
jgi:DNA repair exonuclease SbcCD ATPase subunit